METWKHVLLKKLTRFYITPLDSRNYTNPTKCPPNLQTVTVSNTEIISLITIHIIVQFFKNATKSKTAKIQEIRSKTFNEFTYLRIFKYCLNFFFFLRFVTYHLRLPSHSFCSNRKDRKLKWKKKTTQKTHMLKCHSSGVRFGACKFSGFSPKRIPEVFFFFNINLETKLPACPYV